MKNIQLRATVIKSIIIVVMVLISEVLVSAEENVNSDKLLILSAAEFDYPPLCFVTKEGRPTGLAVELLDGAAKTMNREITFNTGTWPKIKELLERGEIDVLPLVGRTPERENIFDFTFPYLSLHGAIVVRKSTSDIHRITDLKNRDVAVLKADNAEEYLRRIDSGCRIHTLPSFKKALQNLSIGHYDAVVIQRLLAIQIIAKEKITNLKIIDEPLKEFRQDFCFAVTKGNKEMLSLFNEGLSLLIADGTFDRLYSKWLGDLESVKPSFTTVLKYSAFIAGPLVFIMLVTLVVVLRREVKRRTADLIYSRDQLIKNQKRFNLAMNATRDGLFDWDLVTNDIYYSPGWKKMLGYEENELPNDFSVWESRTAPEDVKRSLEMQQELINKKRDRFEIEFKMKHRDGHWVDILSRATVIFNAEGTATRMVGTHVDISARKQMEKDLENSFARYKLIAEGASGGIWDWDVPNKKVYFSNGWKTMRGYSGGEISDCETEWSNSIHPDDRSQVMLAVQEHHQGRTKVFEMEYRVRHKDGTYFWILDRGKAIHDTNGRVIRMAGSEIDITNRKQAEEALRESELRFMTALSHSSIIVAMTDRDLRYTWVYNPHPDFDPETLIGKRDDEVVQNDGTRHLIQLKQDVIDTKQAKRAEITFPMSNGNITYDITAEPLRDKNGLIIGMVTASNDITENKKSEQIIQQNEANFRQMTDSMQETLSVVDLDGTFLYSNQNAARNMTGGKSEDVTGKNICDLVPSKQAETLIERYRTVYQTGEPFHQEVEVSLPKGATWFFNTLKQIDFGTPPVPAVLSVSLDITERKKMEANLLYAQKMESLGNLAGGIAHDFNNILFPIVGMSELLLEDLPAGSVEHENAQEIYHAGKRGADLVKQILAFSRQTEQKKIPVRIQQILKEVMKLSRASIPANINITQNIQSDCSLVTADPTQIHQIGMNLITNAYHAIELNSGGIDVRLSEIEIGVENFADGKPLPGRYVLLSVSDTGTGIDPSVLNKIFDPYFTTKEQGKGTGLGLATAYGIVMEHHGDIKVSSELGKGTTFDVYLPTITKVEIPQSVESIEKTRTGHESILLVDDEESIVKLEKQMLERMGYKVTFRLHSGEALEAFKSSPDSFDLVLTDMSMPHMTGVQLAEAILSIRPDTPIIICTGFSERMDENIAESLGISALLMKPIVQAELAQMIRKVIDEVNLKNQI